MAAQKIPFAIVDVFSTTPYKGNPLAIVDARNNNNNSNHNSHHDNESPTTITDTQMKLLTRQFNLSETTFFFSPTSLGDTPSSEPESGSGSGSGESAGAKAKADFKLRSFLPYGWEVHGAGHNILGVWWYLAHKGVLDFGFADDSRKKKVVGEESERKGKEEFIFRQELGGEVIPVVITREEKEEKKEENKTLIGKEKDKKEEFEYTVAIRQAPPRSHAVHDNPAVVAAALRLDEGDIGFPSSFLSSESKSVKVRPQIMSTSTTHHLLVPVASVAALDRAVVDREKLVGVLDGLDGRAHGIFWFTPVPVPVPVPGEGDGIPTFQARFYSRGMTAEDPATGSAAGPLAAYLYRNGLLRVDRDGEARIKVLQGLKLGRECVIEVRLAVGEELQVDLVGGGALVAEGEVVLPGLETEF